MKYFYYILLFVIAVKAVNHKPHYDLRDAPALFEKYIIDYNKNYKDDEDKAAHYQAFVKSLRKINKMNANPTSGATFDINAFTDYTPEETKNLFGYGIPNAKAVNPKPHYNLRDAPALFEKYIIDYNKNYKDDEDKAAHYQAFVKSLKKINKMNADPTNGATFDINAFTDYTPEETKNLFGYGIPKAKAVNHKPHYDLRDAPALFEKYIIDYNKNYKDDEDKAAHYQAFVKSLKKINKMNANPTSGATFDINAFTDYTPEETKNLFGYGIPKAKAVNHKPHYNLRDAPALFEKYIIDYNKNYKDDEDKAAHYQAFVKSLKKINKMNADPTNGATFDINEFTDYTPEETKNLFGYGIPNKYRKPTHGGAMGKCRLANAYLR